MLTPLHVLKQLEAIRAETLHSLTRLTQPDLDRRNGADWSLGELFHHLALDEHYLREQIARPLLEGVAPPASIRYIPPPPAHGLPKEALGFWFVRARELTQRLLTTDWPVAPNLELRHDGGLVEVFGGPPMNGLEWLESFGGHEAFHQRQIQALIQLAHPQVVA